MQPPLERQESYSKQLIYKILVIGDKFTGKSSLIRRYTKGLYTQNYKATIGLDWAAKELSLEDGTIIRLQFWDIAGQGILKEEN